ncbi:MAG: FAD-dependent oxidoreductase [Phenylobacterium sp.]|nr:MAG: FAD-dependent oxidoreductase [Phenylobacterium sp.]
MTRGAKVTVAGAGALGLSCALALADAGCAVTLCDPDPEASASAVAAGMIAPVFEAVLDAAAAPAFDLLLAARDQWPGLEARAGVRLDRSGAMAVGDAAWLAGVSAGLVRLGLHGIDLPRRTATELAPGLSTAFDHATLVREDWRLEPRPALAALRAAAESAGVQTRREAIQDVGDADWLVVATGAAQGLAPELAELTPIKGQIVRYAELRGAGVSVRAEGCYAVPAADGLAIGATMEPGLADTAPDLEALAPMLAAGARLFPSLEDASFGLSAGVRAASPDGLPMAGFSAAPKVILATGARRNGWLLAPLMAQVVAACVTGRDAGPYVARLDPRRFEKGSG